MRVAPASYNIFVCPIVVAVGLLNDNDDGPVQGPKSGQHEQLRFPKAFSKWKMSFMRV